MGKFELVVLFLSDKIWERDFMIQVFQPSLGGEELDALSSVFASNWIGKGRSVQEFTDKFALSLEASPEHFLSTTSCTEGLFLAGELLDFKEEDEVIAPSVSFIAVGNSVLSRKAKLVLCDVDPRSLNTTAEFISRKISSRTKAVFINHYGGVPCDMDPILDLCNQHNIMIIEDSACAVRSFYKGRAAGTMGDIGTWSFDSMKSLSAGSGGMLYFKSLDILNIAQEALFFGLPVGQKSGTDSSKAGNTGWWEIEVNRFGRFAVMNNITAAIALVQLNKLDSFIKKRQAIYDRYARELGHLAGITCPPALPGNIISSYYFFWIQLEQRDQLAKFLLENGVYSTFRYWPLHKVDRFNCTANDLPNSDHAAAQTLNLPLHQALSDEDVSKVIGLVQQFNRDHM